GRAAARGARAGGRDRVAVGRALRGEAPALRWRHRRPVPPARTSRRRADVARRDGAVERARRLGFGARDRRRRALLRRAPAVRDRLTGVATPGVAVALTLGGPGLARPELVLDDVGILAEEQRGLGVGIDGLLGPDAPGRADHDEDDTEPAQDEHDGHEDGDAHKKTNRFGETDPPYRPSDPGTHGFF